MPMDVPSGGMFVDVAHLQSEDKKPESNETPVDLRPFGFMLIGAIIASSTGTILGAIYVGGFAGIVIGAASTAPGGMLGYGVGWIISKIWKQQ